MGNDEKDIIRSVLETARRHGFASVRLRDQSLKFKATLSDFEAIDDHEVVQEGAVIQDIAPPEPEARCISANAVGYFHFGKLPVKVGDAVVDDQVVGEIHALGIPNELASGLSGTIEALLVKDGEPVEFGQPLFKVKA